MTHYPLDTKLTKVFLFIDWHAYEGDPSSPQVEWMINTSTSEYHPGKLYGVIYIEDLLGSCKMRLAWRSPIYSPYVHHFDNADGSLKSPRMSKDKPVDLTDLLQSIAHILVFGPFADPPKRRHPPFEFEYQNDDMWERHWTHCSSISKINLAFKLVSSFFSRA